MSRRTIYCVAVEVAHRRSWQVWPLNLIDAGVVPPRATEQPIGASNKCSRRTAAQVLISTQDDEVTRQ